MKILLFIFFFSIASNAQDGKSKDVFDIARFGTIEEMKILETKDSEIINSVSPSGFTPLILACYKGNTDIAKYLITKVKDINYNSSSGTALAATVVKGNSYLTSLLLENKADPNIKDASGLTPLIYAIQFKNIEIIKLLLNHKANKTLADSSGKMPFEYAIFTQNQEIINLFKN